MFAYDTEMAEFKRLLVQDAVSRCGRVSVAARRLQTSAPTIRRYLPPSWKEGGGQVDPPEGFLPGRGLDASPQESWAAALARYRRDLIADAVRYCRLTFPGESTLARVLLTLSLPRTGPGRDSGAVQEARDQISRQQARQSPPGYVTSPRGAPWTT